MKKVILSIAVVSAMLAGTNAKAQLIDEQNVTVTMDLQPILQLGMNGAQNVDFVFDQISEYVGGITQYGATALSVSSTVSWDLYAAGFSANAASGQLIWDNQVSYGEGNDVNATTSLPLTLLELHQDKINPATTSYSGIGGGADYFASFQTASTNLGSNNIYAASTPYVRPGALAKYIAGHNSNTAFVVGGTYLVSQGVGTASSVGARSNYYYTIDYRIVPGLPATFPRATAFAPTHGGNTTASGDLTTQGAGKYARPGVYTMNVKYLLVEN
jgi:hypothetical protein